MKRYNGSFTIEAACIIPLILSCCCIAVSAGISMHEEIDAWIQEQENNERIDMIKEMYRIEYIEELWKGIYED